MVQAILAGGAHEPFGEGVGSRRHDRGADRLDPDGGEHLKGPKTRRAEFWECVMKGRRGVQSNDGPAWERIATLGAWSRPQRWAAMARCSQGCRRWRVFRRPARTRG